MDEKYSKKNPIWEEIFIKSSEEDQPTAPISEIKDYFGTDEPAKNEIGQSKNQILANISKELSEKGFEPENFLSTDLSGNIRLKTGNFTTPIYPEYAKTKEQEKPLLSAIDEVLEFYQTNFLNDPVLLEYLTPILLKQNRIAELIQLMNQFNRRNMLPLKFQMFLILVGVYSKKLENLILSGDETKLLNILYKYKFLSLSKLEKNRLYDLVISKENPDLLGIIFHLFGDVHSGIRNIYPIHKLILKNFGSMEKAEKKIFLESYKETGRYLEIFFLLKKVYKKKEIKNWLEQTKKINGKTLPSPEKTFPGFNEKDDIMQKYKVLSKENASHTLSPFEILLLLNTSANLQLKKEIMDTRERIPYSYIANRSLAVIHYYEADYKNFLLYMERTGSLGNHSECVYLKAVSYMELGYKEQAKYLLSALHSAFPNADVIKDSLKKLGVQV